MITVKYVGRDDSAVVPRHWCKRHAIGRRRVTSGVNCGIGHTLQVLIYFDATLFALNLRPRQIKVVDVWYTASSMHRKITGERRFLSFLSGTDDELGSRLFNRFDRGSSVMAMRSRSS